MALVAGAYVLFVGSPPRFPRLLPGVQVLPSGLAALAADLGHVFSVLADSFAALTADLRHVLTVTTDGLTTFAGDFSLLGGVHRSKAALLSTFTLCHES